MPDIAYLALMLACMACCVGVIDWLSRSEKPAVVDAAGAAHTDTPATAPGAER